MRVVDLGIDRRPAEVELDLGADYRDLEDLLRESDSVSLHVSFTPQTRQLINVRRLALMKPTAVLVNTSVGPAGRGACAGRRVRRAAVDRPGADGAGGAELGRGTARTRGA